ncbi:MAG: acetyl-CoA carboxylase biotin carboxylase subunit, partial [Planctomycetes bacterium]|nr:acetyl-CoA carboxylase biotin carboxylase subunit [Planctomycetota bacterium]
GERLDLRQKKVKREGVSIECRINAEDPDNDFRPSIGKISMCSPPGGLGVRLDSHVYSGYEISPYYDSLLGKLIVFQKTREETIACMKRALSEYKIEGVKTTIPLHMNIITDSRFLNGDIDTLFVEKLLNEKE